MRGFGELRGGNIGVRVATTQDEIDAAQALRYRVFYDEMGAEPDAAAAASRRDRDAFDAVADHLLVVDHAIGPGPESVVATYRLIRAAADSDWAVSIRRGIRHLAGGRSSPASDGTRPFLRRMPDYRNRAAMQLLWRGIAAYVSLHHIDLMFGCASLPGTDPDALATELTYLYDASPRAAGAAPAGAAAPLCGNAPAGPGVLDPRRALAKLPPLIKGYLRLGGFVGDGAVIDPQFNTIDVAVVVKTELVTEKYYRHYERQARDSAD